MTCKNMTKSQRISSYYMMIKLSDVINNYQTLAVSSNGLQSTPPRAQGLFTEVLQRRKRQK